MMSKEVSVYKQLQASPAECLNVLKREIGLKTDCIPFAVKLITATKELNLATEQENLAAANTLLSGLQTLSQGGILPEDYDKIDFVKRGKTIVPSARVEAFLRAAARKGYTIIDTIVAVPQEDNDGTYFREVFSNDNIVYVLEDSRKNMDRAITALRLKDKYFSKFLCRLDIHEAKTGRRVAMISCDMSIDDMLQVSMSSAQGIFKSEWRKVEGKYGPKNEKVITDDLNSGTFWIKWTGEMVNKTIIRRALKRVKEVLPELREPIYAFEQDEYTPPVEEIKEAPVIEIPVKAENVNLKAFTEEQKADCKEMYDIFCQNPKLAEDKAAELEYSILSGADVQDVINKEYASIAALMRSSRYAERIGRLLNEAN